MHSVETIKANTTAMMKRIGAPMTRQHLTAAAEGYEKGYRRNRASRRPPSRRMLCGQIQTARAFYSLARHAER